MSHKGTVYLASAFTFLFLCSGCLADLQCGTHGSLQSSGVAGGNGGGNSLQAYSALCPPSSFVTGVKLSTSNGDGLIADIRLICTGLNTRRFYVAAGIATSAPYGAPQLASSAFVAPGILGFNSVTGWASSVDIVSLLTFNSSTGISASVGLTVGNTNASQPFTFALPSRALVAGLNINYGLYFDNIQVMYCA